jgi:hypothetical protein
VSLWDLLHRCTATSRLRPHPPPFCTIIRMQRMAQGLCIYEDLTSLTPNSPRANITFLPRLLCCFPLVSLFTLVAYNHACLRPFEPPANFRTQTPLNLTTKRKSATINHGGVKNGKDQGESSSRHGGCCRKHPGSRRCRSTAAQQAWI